MNGKRIRTHTSLLGADEGLNDDGVIRDVAMRHVLSSLNKIKGPSRQISQGFRYLQNTC